MSQSRKEKKLDFRLGNEPVQSIEIALHFDVPKFPGKSRFRRARIRRKTDRKRVTEIVSVNSDGAKVQICHKEFEKN